MSDSDSDDVGAKGDEEEKAPLKRLRDLLAPAPQEPEEKPKTEEDIAAPAWTKRYIVVNAEDPPTPIEDIRCKLHPAVVQALRKQGYTAFFPIQNAVVPLLTKAADLACDVDSPYSCDMCVAAPTGQGKTLAYAVPIVQACMMYLEPKPRAIVLLPTRDLASQVHTVLSRLENNLLGEGCRRIRSAYCVGEKSFLQEQLALKEKPVDILVCTPGRLADHFASGSLDLASIRWFVIDEADRLLTQTYQRWLDALDAAASASAKVAGDSPLWPRLQKLLFSATMTWDPQKLAMLKLRRPLYFFSSLTGQYATPPTLKQRYAICGFDAKPLALLHLLNTILKPPIDKETPDEERDGDVSGRALVFCDSVDATHRLSRLLQVCCMMPSMNLPGIMKPGDEESSDSEEEQEIPKLLVGSGRVAEFSSNLGQDQRATLLSRFRRGHVACLVCSDVVARGLDIPEVKVVVNYALPSSVQGYIHRVGRTARAGREGHAFTLLRRPALGRFKAMMAESADCSRRMEEHRLPVSAKRTWNPWYKQALALLGFIIGEEESGRLPPTTPLTFKDLETALNGVVGPKDPADAEPRRAEEGEEPAKVERKSGKKAKEPIEQETEVPAKKRKAEEKEQGEKKRKGKEGKREEE